ncbi:MAG: Holliday junction resolvase RuvX [Bacteroidales bacterium]|nr:Holliday junction resolvase RuvX [Bacteroidales bacterium]
MSRIIAIDFGKKRTGIAVTDNLQIISNGLTTVESKNIYDFLADYLGKEDVERIVVGYARQTNGKDSDSMKFITPFVNRLKKLYPSLPVEYYDERYTSKIAEMSLKEMGLGKKMKKNKGMVDQMSATILLQSYMESRSNMLNY